MAYKEKIMSTRGENEVFHSIFHEGDEEQREQINLCSIVAFPSGFASLPVPIAPPPSST